MPLEMLLRCMRDGQIVSKQEDGFTFVDMAPGGPKLSRPMTPAHLRPPTFTMAKENVTPPPPPPPPSPSPSPSPSDENAEPEEGFEDDTASKELGDWRSARRKASRLRIPPPKRPST
jgi:hypothetical protein